ncbi:MAG: hypothetical protein NT069_34405, partial [Planctomycetota bacterium]|nr:hypothetical protein [Planctomycetota bacterium]
GLLQFWNRLIKALLRHKILRQVVKDVRLQGVPSRKMGASHRQRLDQHLFSPLEIAPRLSIGRQFAEGRDRVAVRRTEPLAMGLESLLKKGCRLSIFRLLIKIHGEVISQ